ncbi:MAG: hypothetical protein LBK05_04480 [Treponema sp.]|jgi:hypothetical protein|nr:hypothetical protein [Treponema sp.]
MPKKILLFLIPVLLLSCKSLAPGAEQPVSEGGFWNSGRFRQGLVFFGVSGGYYVSRNRAVDLALRDAARRLSFYHSVEAFIQFDETYYRQFQGSQIDTARGLIHDEDYEKYIGALEFDPEQDVYEDDNVLFVRAGYTGPDAAPVNSVPSPPPRAFRSGAQKPSWIESPPSRIDGRPASIGFSGPRLSYKDTLTASYEDAVFALVQNYFYAVAAGQTAGNTEAGDCSAARAAGVVMGFYVLETWTDSVTGGVWTLAVAREVKSGIVSGELTE